MAKILDMVQLQEDVKTQLSSENAELYVKTLKLAEELTLLKNDLYQNLNETEKNEIKVVMSNAKANNYPEYLTTQEVAKILQISTQMVRRYCGDGRIKAIQRMEGTGAWLIKTEQFIDHPNLPKVLDAKANNRNKSIAFAKSMLELLNE